MPPDDRLDLRKIDLVIFPDDIAHRIFAKWQAAMLTMRRPVVFVCIGRFRQRASMTLMPRLATTGPRTFPLALPIGRGRL